MSKNTDKKDTPKAAARAAFSCSSCGDEFTMAKATLDRYPGWQPSQCPRCYSGKKSRGGRPVQQGNLLPVDDGGKKPAAPAAARPGASSPGQQSHEVEPDSALSQALEQVLADYQDGPKEGVFTDGASHGNPGPGGWGAVVVRDDEVVQQRYGRSPDTTNNRMELRALMAAFEMIDPGDDVTIWSDSQLCVNTINQWAAGWKRRGWKRKGGAIKNLDLVRPLYELACTRPPARLKCIKAPVGFRWNQYADTLADPDL